ncbi:hypothetical protein Ddye_012930 [Dipteronia dyeriana]|uniref:Uncharacterized protein n=1 Tax=Dipteronia dyeriana TaxID=168575 RepID=A0AAD9X596_9ROSI|nr:hypothetical protein Ddye_012930 [Dipteronia dyeriana]
MPSMRSRGVPTPIDILSFHSSMRYRDDVRRDASSHRAMLDIPWRDICFRGDPLIKRRFRDSKGYRPFSSCLRGRKSCPQHLRRLHVLRRHRPEEEDRGGRCSETEPSDPTGTDFSGMDTGGSEPSSWRVRHRRVQFTTPGLGAATWDSREVVGRDGEAPWEH